MSIFKWSIIISFDERLVKKPHSRALPSRIFSGDALRVYMLRYMPPIVSSINWAWSPSVLL